MINITTYMLTNMATIYNQIKHMYTNIVKLSNIILHQFEY